MAEIHSRTLVVRELTEIDPETVRVSLREKTSVPVDAARAPAGMTGGTVFSFNIATADAPDVGTELETSVSTVA